MLIFRFLTREHFKSERLRNISILTILNIFDYQYDASYIIICKQIYMIGRRLIFVKEALL